MKDRPPRPVPPPKPRHRQHRRRSHMGRFFMIFGFIAVMILLAKYALIPMLVWVETLVGGVS